MSGVLVEADVVVGDTAGRATVADSGYSGSESRSASVETSGEELVQNFAGDPPFTYFTY